jgi:hypothetical protein
MNVIKRFRVHINDIFDITGEHITAPGRNIVYNNILNNASDIAIGKRIQYAFNKDGNGANFWENFFLCDAEHRKLGCAIVYILTKPQLLILQDWWYQIIETPDQTVKDNLTKSKKTCFGTTPSDDKLEIGKKKRMISSLYVYYVDKDIDAKDIRLIRVFFDKSPPIVAEEEEKAEKEKVAREKAEKKNPKKEKEKKWFDFFIDRVSVDHVKEITVENRITVFNTIIITLKRNVEQSLKKDLSLIDLSLIEYIIPKKKKWLYYLGKVKIEHEWVKNCQEVRSPCSLVNEYYQNSSA